MNKKLKFLFIWLLFLLIGPVVVVSNINPSIIGQNKILIINLVQRFFGMSAFGLLTFQITLGGNMEFFRNKFGSFVLSFHKLNGIFTYFFVFLHPATWIVWNYFLRGNIDVYYPFIDVCGLCKPKVEYFYNLGRLGFWSITFAVVAARLVTIINDKWLNKNWRKVHLLNYLAFYFVSIHAFFIGSDTKAFLFNIFFLTSQFLVLNTILKKK